MNKQPTIAKLISGGEGIVDLNVSETLTTNNLNVTGSNFVNIPNLYVSSHLEVYDGTTNSNVDLVPYIDANNQNIANLQQATTNITYGGIYTNIPNLYIGNDLLLFDSSTGSSIDVVPTLDTLKTNTTNISYMNSKTNIPDLYVNNSLTLYDTSHHEDIDVVSRLNSLSTKTSGITVDGSGKMSIVELLVTNKLSVYDPVGGNKDIIYTLDSQQDQITNNTNDIKSINTKLNNTVTNSSLTTTLSGYALTSDLQATNNSLNTNYPTNSALNTKLGDYALGSTLTNNYPTNSALSTKLGDYALNTDLQSTNNNITNNLVTNTSLDNTLGSYATQSNLTKTNSAFNTLKDDLATVGIKFKNLSSLGTLVPIGGIPTPISSIPLSYINNIDDQTIYGKVTFNQDPSFPALTTAQTDITNLKNTTTGIQYANGYTNMGYVYVNSDLILGATNIRGFITSTNNSISSNTSNIATNTSSINNLNSQMTSTTGSINSLNSQMSTANNNISSNTTMVNSLNSQMTTANNNISNNTTSITTLNAQMSSANSNISSNNLSISNLNSQMTSANININSINNSINTINNNVSNISLTVGPTGATGAKGSTGAQGTQGIQGATGPTGAQGIQGATGAIGATGATGPQGIQGPQGVTGATGAKGSTGSQGPTGTFDTSMLSNYALNSALTTTNSNVSTLQNTTQGIQYANGYTNMDYVYVNSDLLLGATHVGSFITNTNNSISSNTNDVSNLKTLLTGASYDNVYNFLNLNNNLHVFGNLQLGNIPNVESYLTNLTLKSGPTGPAGTNGTNGTNGATGATGPQGIQGPAGATGTNGTNGATGPQGIQGATGAIGATGTNGTNGAIGATGPQGIQGTAGTNGTNGTNGATGTTGPAGTNGTNGTNGATGATGPQGIQGPAGSGGISLSTANTFTATQTFSNIIVTGTESDTTLNVSGNATLGTSGSNNTLQVNSAPTFANGLTVSSGTISFPSNSISTSAINGISNYLTTATASSTYATSSALSTTNTLLTGATWDSTFLYLNLNNNLHIYGNLQLGAITNVESILTSLGSTYATISSLSAYVKTNLTNTFSALQTFNAGIGLPSSTMTAPASNQIGYIISSSSLVAGATITTKQTAYTLGSITLNGPVNSVWMVASQFGLASASGSLSTGHWGINLGSSWSFATNLYGITTMTPTTNPFEYYNTSYATVVQPATNQVITLGAYINPGGAGVQIKCWGITATRIA